jgi:hypothetical protein
VRKKLQHRKCYTECECGMCGHAARLVPGETGREFVVKIGEVQVVRLRVHPAELALIDTAAVRVQHPSHWRPDGWSKEERLLAATEAVAFVRNLGLSVAALVAALTENGWEIPEQSAIPAESRLVCNACGREFDARRDWTPDLVCPTCGSTDVGGDSV